MKILFAPHGTHGDLRPLIALAVKLRERGHKILFCGNRSDTSFISKYKIENYAADFDLNMDLIKYKDVKSIKGQMNILKHHFICLEKVILENIKEIDLIIGSGYQFIGSSIAEYFRIPYIHTLHSAVFYPTSYSPPVDIPYTNLPGIINRSLWKIHDLLTRIIIIPHINTFRSKYNLKPFKSTYEIYRKHMILSTNQALSPLPPDVACCRYITDYWYLFEEMELNNEILNFIDSGNKPVYIGFGSMTERFGEKLKYAVKSLLENTDIRFVVSGAVKKAISGINNERIFELDYAPHHKLFPKMKVVVHHGGAGTSSTAMLAGVPQIIVPHMADQYYFGERIRKLKIGPGSVRLKNIDKELPVRVMEVINNPDYENEATDYTNKLSNKSGVDDAVFIIEGLS